VRFYKHRFRLLLALVVLGGLVSCGGIRFYGQAVSGQAQIWWRSKPIPEVLSAATTSPRVSEQLRLVNELRDFASSNLHLPAHRAYSDYADLGRRHVVWVVYAAPEFAVEPKTWWYPVVGSLGYRGFFNEDAARKHGQKLRQEGYDVLVGGVDGYSTLGWFRDPILNTFLYRTDAELAELIFHELTHVKLFVPGDTEFNEALATCVGQEGVRRWLAAKGLTRALAEYEADLRKDSEIIRLLLAKRTELEALYIANKHLSLEQRRAAKSAAYTALKNDYQVIRQRWKGDSRYDALFKSDINNARLCTIATYYDLVPAFDQKLAQFHGDLDQFFDEMESLQKLSKSARRERLGLPAAKE
jgi:predicted aminopeptidase